tara:strand:+ start:42 stop:1301 length:1260 start_codon:yes stop_codon:yes gene_type:complete
MKNTILSFLMIFCVASFVISQSDVPPRGPYNTMRGGITDGVVIKDEVPIRSAVPYEHVRLADYVWSKRVFSRIDAREKLNHELFFPFDSYDSEYFKPPTTESEVDSPYWIKHQERWSLWTVILRHIMLGDLKVYRVADPIFNPAQIVEDGYQFKYPIDFQSGKDDYLENDVYKNEIHSVVAASGPGPNLKAPILGQDEILMRTSQSFVDWRDSIAEIEDDPTKAEILLFDQADLEMRYNKAQVDGVLKGDGPISFQSSQGITAYNIKEDWFFDKERSVLDKRIIAIAPVCKYTKVKKESHSEMRGDMVTFFDGVESFFQGGSFVPLEDQATVQLEMFWLYFPDLRNVMVNYYTYNDRSDAQWMSFDDLFWKRKYNAQIYRTSDKFDREIEDYRFGVDALYEAEKVKGEIRKWEHDVWNY